MSHRLDRRAGLTINPLVLLLFLVLVALAVWYGWQVLDALPVKNSPGYETGKRVGVIMGCTLGVLITTAIAGGVGLTAYFISGKSEFAANSGIGVVLLLACGLYGSANYLIATRTPPSAPSANQGVQAPSLAPAPLKNEAVELMEAQKRALQEQMERTRRYAIDHGSGAPQPSQITSTPSGSTPAPAPTQARHEPTAAEIEEAKVAQQALAPLRKDIQSKLDGFLTEASTLVTSLGSSPKALKSELETRISSTTSLKGKAADLESYLRSLDSKADAALKGAGLDMGGQIRQKVAFTQSLEAFTAANACGTYSRLFDAGLEEAQALRDNAGKWRYDASNQVASTDRGLQMRLRQLREVVLQRLRSIPEAESALKRLKQSAASAPATP